MIPDMERNFRFMLCMWIVAASLGFVLFFALVARGEARPFDANGNVTRQVIGGRPHGCPRAYCGCGLARFLGLHDVRLNLARNWARLFPHTPPVPGAAAVRRHHVMLLVQQVSGSNWVVRDYNGGRGLSYIHVRNVRGYSFVMPQIRMAGQ